MEDAIISPQDVTAMLIQVVMLPQFLKRVGLARTGYRILAAVLSSLLALTVWFWSNFHIVAERVAVAIGMLDYAWPVPQRLTVYEVIRVSAWEYYSTFWLALAMAIGVWYQMQDKPEPPAGDPGTPPDRPALDLRHA